MCTLSTARISCVLCLARGSTSLQAMGNTERHCQRPGYCCWKLLGSHLHLCRLPHLVSMLLLITRPIVLSGKTEFLALLILRYLLPQERRKPFPSLPWLIFQHISSLILTRSSHGLVMIIICLYASIGKTVLPDKLMRQGGQLTHCCGSV